MWCASFNVNISNDLASTLKRGLNIQPNRQILWTKFINYILDIYGFETSFCASSSSFSSSSIQTWHWWSKYNICICIQGHLCYKFWLKSRYQPIQTIQLRNKPILDRVNSLTMFTYNGNVELNYIFLCMKRPNMDVLDA